MKFAKPLTAKYFGYNFCINLLVSFIHRHAGIINLAMNAGKFVSDTSHQHNTSLHFYLHRSSPSTTTSSSPLQQQTETTPVKDTLRTNSTISVEDNNEQSLKSTRDQMKGAMGSTNKDSSWLLSNNRSIREVDTSGSVKNLKRKSSNIQSYFMMVSGTYIL